MSVASLVTSVTAAEEVGPSDETKQRRESPKRLTARDKQLLVVLATARYLSTEQLARLFFPTRLIRTAETHLEWLSGQGKRAMETPVLKRLTLPRLESLSVRAWAPTALGYEKAGEAAGKALKRPEKDIALEFLAHQLQLNELLVALLEPAAPKRPMPLRGRFAAQVYARAPQLFRWVSSDSARLPWREYDAKAARRRERVILPDAVLEIPGRGADFASPPPPRDLAPAGADPDLRSRTRVPGRRFFLECEMGTHSIVSATGEKSGSTVSKVDRYHQYCRRLADPVQRTTYYAAQYRDGYEPEVLFLVKGQERAEHINQALGVWRKGCTEEPVRARGVTFADAARELRAAIGANAPCAPSTVEGRASSASLAKSQVELLSRFFSEAVLTLQTTRHQIRAVPEALRRAHHLTEPAYPKDTRAVSALVNAFQTSLNGGGT